MRPAVKRLRSWPAGAGRAATAGGRDPCASAFPRRSRSSSTASASRRRRCASSSRTAMRCGRARRRAGIGVTDAHYQRGRRDDRGGRGRGLRRGRHDRQGQGAAGRGARDAAPGPDRCSPTCISRPTPSRPRDLVASQRDLHRLRDRDVAERRPAAARADVRGRRAHVDPGRRATTSRSRTADGRAARRRARRRRRRKVVDPRRRRRRHARDAHRARHGRRREGARPQRSTCCAGCGRSSAPAQHRVLDPRRDRAARRDRRPRDRRRADPGRRRAEARHARDWSRRCSPARWWSTSPSTRAAASRRRGRRRTPTRPTSSTASSTTASPTCRAACRAPRRSRSTTRRCRSCSRSPTRAGSARSPTTRTCGRPQRRAGKVTCRPVAEALGYPYVDPLAALADRAGA